MEEGGGKEELTEGSGGVGNGFELDKEEDDRLLRSDCFGV